MWRGDTYVYQKLAINTNRTVSARTNKKTLCDNLCFVYSSCGRNQYALLKKVVSCGVEEYAIGVLMVPARRQLCCDDVTKAKLNSHLTTLNPPM